MLGERQLRVYLLTSRKPSPMKCSTLLSLVLIAAASCARAQTTVPYYFTAAEVESCLDGATVETTAEVEWRTDNSACLEAVISEDATSVTLSGLLGEGDEVRAFRVWGGDNEALNRLPGDENDYYAVSVTLAEGNQWIDYDGLAYAFFGAGEFDIAVTAPGQPSCGQIVPGGTDIRFQHLSAATTGEVAELSFSISYEPVDPSALLTRINVPATDRLDDGSYRHELPDGDVYLVANLDRQRADGEASVPVSLVEPAASPRDIVIAKSGGSLVATHYFEFAPGLAADGEPHRVELVLDNAELCIAESEVVIKSGAVLTLNDASVRFPYQMACLAVERDAEIAVAEGSVQQFGRDGHGFLMWRGGTLSIGAGAQVTIGGLVEARRSAETSVVEVGPGASLTIAEGALTLDEAEQNRSGDGKHVLVRLAEGASFDASAASPGVRAMFVLDGAVGLAAPAIPEEHYRLAGNVLAPGEPIRLLVGDGAAPLERLRLVDASGRVVGSSEGLDAARGSLTAPVAGLYVLHLVDGHGRAAALRVLAAN